MKFLAMMGALALGIAMAAPAGAIEVVTGSAQVRPHPDLAPVLARGGSYAVSQQLPELPEPEVVAMMLLGLVLIGYRATRDSSEKFK